MPDPKLLRVSGVILKYDTVEEAEKVSKAVSDYYGVYLEGQYISIPIAEKTMPILCQHLHKILEAYYDKRQVAETDSN